MSLSDLLFLAVRYCKKRFFESLLIVLAIGLGVGVIVTVLALFNGVRLQQEDFLQQPNYRTIRVTAMEDIMQAFANTDNPLISIPQITWEERPQFILEDLEMLKQVFPDSHVFAQQTGAYPLDTGAGTVQPASSAMMNMNREDTIPAILTTAEYFSFMNLRVNDGSLFSDTDVEQATAVVVLGAGLAERLYGQDDPVGQTLRLAGDDRPYYVLGVLAPTTALATDGSSARELNNQAYLPITAAPRRSFGRGVGTSAATTHLVGITEMRIGLPIDVPLATVLREVRDYAGLTYGDVAAVYAPFEDLQAQQQRFVFMGIIIFLFASIGLLIAAVNILTLMLARILRRTRNIGLSRALGADQRGIFMQFLVEAGVLGLAGSVLGITISYGGVQLVSALLEEPLSHSLLVQLAGVGVALTVTFIFGIYPPYQGARIRPVDALRVE